MRLFSHRVLCAAALLGAASMAHGRTFTDASGRTLEAEIVSYDGGDSVVIRRVDGQEFKLPLARLSEADQEFVRAWVPESERPVAPEEIKKLNDVLGMPLFADGYLWDDDTVAVAQRLGWPEESKTATQESYRQYNGPTDKIAGARPFSSALYGRDGKVDMLSIVFANKGDSAGNAFAMSEREIEKAVFEAVKKDGDTIGRQLSALGEPEQLTTATGRNMKERQQLWTWRDHVISLAVQDDEYVVLRVMPAKLAASRGRPERVNSSELKSLSAANVTTTANGDVVIANIPMVDQGPKGYCVPATLERVLRYMGVRADMYMLAMAGQTQIGGGTYVDELIEGTERYVKSAGREMQPARIKLKAKDVAKYIDAGQPIIWSLSSTPEYNAAVNAFTASRQKFDKVDDWKREMSAMLNRTPDMNVNPETGHVCLIIGYNKDTDEIAVSDSWGPQYAVRWAPAEVAEQITQGQYWVVDF